jgi:hypothetical protein
MCENNPILFVTTEWIGTKTIFIGNLQLAFKSFYYLPLFKCDAQEKWNVFDTKLCAPVLRNITELS